MIILSLYPKLNLFSAKSMCLSILFLSFSINITAQSLYFSKPPELKTHICLSKYSAATVNIEVEAKTCDNHKLSYTWQKMRPKGISGDSLFHDIDVTDYGYEGQNEEKLTIYIDSIGGYKNYYKYRCAVTSVGPISSNCPPVKTIISSEAEVVGIDNIKTNYENEINYTICETESLNLKAFSTNLSPNVFYEYKWVSIDQYPILEEEIIAEGGYDAKNLSDTFVQKLAITMENDKNIYFLSLQDKAKKCQNNQNQDATRVLITPTPQIEALRDTFWTEPNKGSLIDFRIVHAKRERPGSDVYWNYDLTGDIELLKYFSEYKLNGKGNTYIFINLPDNHNLSPGFHAIQINNLRNISDITDCMIDTIYKFVLKVEANSLKYNALTQPLQYNIRPNPFNEYLDITVSQKTNIELSDVNGKVLLAKNIKSGFNKLNFSNLSDGIYFLNFITNDKIYHVKLNKMGEN